ncbi:unnamed protein product [Didymodactylos carnosus]|uniref:Glutaredoxin domain-containing protein n=1 Tax=Didymodactylos carnosus TaxID=1234261 RepID=A0A814ZE54_9BILA|nr:unnamed protein product [Didymodactylos carnosus]CAF1242874.1 unnamed protein product [Didymodactylos carnosus]CAF4006834.1 unnamed protein product [Didymodactylos carnosus]CAF4048869.1 unnamed protein product [Didymodactylos carnosus]
MLLAVTTYRQFLSQVNHKSFRQLFQMSNKSSAVADQAKNLIKHNTVVVFSKTACPYCVKDNVIMDGVVTKNQIDDGNSYQQVLGEITSARSVPRIFVAGKCIGGGDDTKALDKKGELEKMLKKADAIQD